MALGEPKEEKEMKTSIYHYATTVTYQHFPNYII